MADQEAPIQVAKNLDSSDEENEPENLQYKVVVLGNGTVGKTSVISRLCDDHFARSYKQTIGVDFFVKRMDLPNNINVALQVWDIGGQSIFSKMITTYIYEANAVVLVYDITNQQSFQDLEDWLELAEKTFKGQELPLTILLGNKVDLNHMQAVKGDLHRQFTEQNKLHGSFYASAKTGDQINQVFYQLAADLAGVKIEKPQLQVAQNMVKAQIINHNESKWLLQEPEEKAKQEEPPKKKSSMCSIF